MVVGVIVSKTARQVDRIFDYDVPAPLCADICIGSRVIVPFGVRSMLCEGYVFEIREESDAKRLKQIESIVDKEPAFDKKGAQLIEYLREKTLCTYIEAVHILIPTGTNVIFEQWVELLECDSDIKEKCIKKSPIKQEIIDVLGREGGKSELGRLMSMWESNIRAHINTLEKNGIVKIVQHDSVNVKNRLVRFVSLNIDDDEAQRLCDELEKKAPRQAKIIDILRANEKVILSDLVYLASASYSTVTSLYKKGIVDLYDVEVLRSPGIDKKAAKEGFKTLTEQQQSAKERLQRSMESGKGDVFLLHGVTGSGKTEVYMHLIKHAISMGKTAIVLVPEISLTPLMTKRFVSRFGERVAILHSALSLGERYDEYKRIKRGEIDVVVGARSAIFAPLDNIGAIIVDEEHEYTYKSEMAPRYHARDVAIYRARQYSAVCVLASATPSIESYYKAKSGVYSLIEMDKRIGEQKMPTVYIEDMRKELENGNRSMFSEMLSNELLYNIEHGEQSILFLNRRGFSTFVSCRSCGYVASCPHCNISLTYHRYTNRLVCHYCGYTHENYSICPQCGSKYIKHFGAGTQKLEEELKKKFEGINTVRMDFDTTSTKSAHEKLLKKFEDEKADVLIGTQMVSKGLDFDNVTLVGVVAADTSLYVDDYRSSERTFNLITQVCGRAGRGKLEGRAIVQTYTPEHSAIVHAKNHDYKGFYNDEIKLRKAMNYPPLCELVSILISGKDEKVVKSYAQSEADRLGTILKNKAGQKTLLLGPTPAALSKIKDKYRFIIVIKCECAYELNDILKIVTQNALKHENSKHISVLIDKNPNNLS